MTTFRSVMDNDALDNWITGGRYNSTRIQVWCQNAECDTYDEEPIEVFAQTEYGTTWWTPDECPVCGGELEEERPED